MVGSVVTALVALLVFAAPAEARDEIHYQPSPVFEITDTGTKFSTLGHPPEHAPTLLLLSSDRETALTVDTFREIGRLLAFRGWLVVSLDLPAHWEDQRSGEPNGLAGWRTRTDAGEDWISPFTDDVSDVLDQLVDDGRTDEDRIAAAGLSRGGFLVLHAMKADERIGAGVLMAPVTDLTRLTEFAGSRTPPDAPLILDRPLWITISPTDDRVGTGPAAHYANRVRAYGGQAVFRYNESATHATPMYEHRVGARWLTRWMLNRR